MEALTTHCKKAFTYPHISQRAAMSQPRSPMPSAACLPTLWSGCWCFFLQFQNHRPEAIVLGFLNSDCVINAQVHLAKLAWKSLAPSLSPIVSKFCKRGSLFWPWPASSLDGVVCMTPCASPLVFWRFLYFSAAAEQISAILFQAEAEGKAARLYCFFSSLMHSA
eukprot:s1774_g1.t1